MTEQSAESTGEAPEPLLPWPPPGLARIQGDLWIAVRRMAAAGIVLVVPLLAALTLPRAGEGLGPFGDAWWILIVTTLLGTALFVEALVMCVRLLGRARVAMARGYSTRVIALAASDQERTGGYLLQGAHEFSAVPDEVRLVLCRVRILSGLMHLASASWLTVAFGVCLLLSARGLLSSAGLATWTLAPSAVFWAAGLILRAVDASLTRRARREWHQHPWSEDLVREEISAWKASAEARGLSLRLPALKRGWLTVLAAVMVTASVIGIVPTVTLVPASSMGAILSAIAGWNFERTARRAAATEVYRSHRLDPDPTMSPEDAGELLNVLSNIAESRRDQGLLEPARKHDMPWFPAEGLEGVEGMEGWRVHVAPVWSDSIWIAADEGLTPEVRAFLSEIAAHPGHEEWARLARAPSLDLIAGFYERPFSPSVAMYDLPIPHFRSIREGASAHLAVAALHSAEGRHADAIRMTREVISVGFLLQDDSPLLIGTLIGSVMVRSGGDALRHALRRSGDEAGAEALRASRDAIDRATDLTYPRGLRLRPGQQGYAERARALAADPAAVRGARWETTHLSAVISPCQNARAIVFGPGPDYDQWLEGVREGLVRTPAEADYFEVVARGLELEGAAAGPIARLLAAAMGGGDAPSSCAHVIGTLRSMM